MAAEHGSVAGATPREIPLSDVAVDAELLDAAREVISSGWWSMGPRVADFEQRFAEFVGVRHAMAVANGTAALHVAMLAVGCQPGDEVIIPSLNFVAAANVAVFVGAVPVFCDIQGEHDLTMDPVDVEAAIGPGTRAIVVMHYGGFPCDMSAVDELAARHGLLVIEDAAHAPGAQFADRSCGTIGDVGCFSFFANKNLPTGEGGMVVTDDDELAARVRLLRSHGMTSLTWDRHRGHARTYDVVLHGLNYRLDELHAALGLVELRRLAEMNALRGSHWARYRELLDGADGLTVPFVEVCRGTPAYHLAVVVLDQGIDRDAVQQRLRERGIATSVHYPPIHRFSAFGSSGARRPLPRTDSVADRLVTLPLYPHMSDDQVSRVAAELVTAISDATV